MKKTIYAGALLLFFCAFDYTLAADPSFDCAKASKRVEHVICESDKLSRQDLKLSKLYKNVMAKLTDDVKKEIKAEQLAWLKNRNQECKLYGKEAEKCLLEQYRKRNTELAAMLAFDSSDIPGNEELKILRITPKGNDVLAG